MDKDIKTAHGHTNRDGALTSQAASFALIDQVGQIEKEAHNQFENSMKFLTGMGDGEVQFVQEALISASVATKYFGNAFARKVNLGADVEQFENKMTSAAQQIFGTAGDYYLNQLPNGRACIWSDISQAGSAVANDWASLDAQQKGLFFGKEVVPFLIPGAAGVVAKELKGVNLGGKANQMMFKTLEQVPQTAPADLIPRLIPDWSRVPAFAGVEQSACWPSAEKGGLDEFLAKMKYLGRELPSRAKLSGRVFPPHTTDSYFAREGDLKVVCKPREDGTGYIAFTDVLINGSWMHARLLDRSVARLCYADTSATMLKNSEKLIKCLKELKGKEIELNARDGVSKFHYKLSDLEQPKRTDLKTISENLVRDKLPLHVDFNGNCRFGSEPPEVGLGDGSIWFKRPKGIPGKSLEGDWEAHVNVGNQWFKCEISKTAIRGDLLHFERAGANAEWIEDALEKGKFSFKRLLKDSDEKTPIRYLLIKESN